LEAKGWGQFTTYQLIVVLSFGNIVGEAIINSDISTAAMIAAVVTIIIVFKLLDYLSTKNKRLEKIINPDIIPLVKDGIIDKEGMIRARIGIKEFNSFMRLAGIRYVNEVEISNLELNGQISFIKKDK
jgi:uncharacterized membrane protein YcaP (DUF421 family)